jgi:hypothetical protein
MMEEGLDARSTRALFLNINKQLQSLRDQLTEAEEVRQEALELQAYFGERLASLPPELSVDQAEILKILEKVNEGREKKLSLYLIEKLLTNDPKEISRLHSLNRKLLVKVETLQEAHEQFKEKSKNKCDALKTQRKRRNTKISSPKYRQQVTKEVVRESIKGTHGYTTTFKNGVVNLQSHCSSINSTPEALDDIYKAVLPFMDEAERKNLTPDRKSVQHWTVHEGDYDLADLAVLMGDRPFGIMADGSKRKKRDLFQISLFWFDDEGDHHEAKVHTHTHTHTHTDTQTHTGPAHWNHRLGGQTLS